MRLSTGIAAVVVLAGLPGGAAVAQSDMQKGKDLAMQICTACHVVTPDQPLAPVMQPPAPSFQSILAKPGMNAAYVSNHVLTTHRDLRSPHNMPNPQLTKNQANAVADYMMTLKR